MSMIGSVGGAKHQFMKVRETLGSIKQKVQVQGQRAQSDAGYGHVLLPATIHPVVQIVGSLPDDEPDSLGHSSDGIRGRTDVFARVLQRHFFNHDFLPESAFILQGGLH